MRYKESRYNHRGALDDKVFLYNLVTSSVALLGTGEYEQILKGEFSSPEVMEMAVENGFVVPYGEDELEKGSSHSAHEQLFDEVCGLPDPADHGLQRKVLLLL